MSIQTLLKITKVVTVLAWAVMTAMTVIVWVYRFEFGRDEFYSTLANALFILLVIATICSIFQFWLDAKARPHWDAEFARNYRQKWIGLLAISLMFGGAFLLAVASHLVRSEGIPAIVMIVPALIALVGLVVFVRTSFADIRGRRK